MRQQHLILATLVFLLFSSNAATSESQTLESVLNQHTRLMVFAPHPDDETLGAGGLIQRVLHMGGTVKVVFMTSGDGYPEGVMLEDHISHPKAQDYREYGKIREGEARRVLAALGVKENDLVFLAFPDGGLCYLAWKYWSDKRPYVSPYTKEDRPPPTDMIIPKTDYSGQDLKKEIVRVLSEFRPTLVSFTRHEDRHPDHCATSLFVQEALAELQGAVPPLRPQLCTYLIHFGDWPIGEESGFGSRLYPPKGFPLRDYKWTSLALTPQEAETKHKALLLYDSQMLVLGRFLLSFSRANELFILRGDAAEELKRVRCCLP